MPRSWKSIFVIAAGICLVVIAMRRSDRKEKEVERNSAAQPNPAVFSDGDLKQNMTNYDAEKIDKAS